MVIAFIPARGGSKSIPLKNIKPFCGKPLIYWNIQALQMVGAVDEIIVATDSDIIEGTVAGFGFEKVSIYRRSAENASDVASTESVMMEYIAAANLRPNDTFILVQATSPLTESLHFRDALTMFDTHEYDSILTCVRNRRFFWNTDGTPINYDYLHRPRRQDFAGVFMENGAFYISRVENILLSKNRLSGKIGLYEMPEYTATEIDEPNDWLILEQLMAYNILKKGKRQVCRIKLFLSDVDGVLTDGGMYYSENGDELKKFNTKDGMAFQKMKEHGLLTGIVTSEITKIVERRAKKMKVDFLIQGAYATGKLSAVMDICKEHNLSLDEVAYVGDDINCKDLLEQVGLAFCPSDAVDAIKSISGIITIDRPGGSSVIREIFELYFHNI